MAPAHARSVSGSGRRRGTSFAGYGFVLPAVLVLVVVLVVPVLSAVYDSVAPVTRRGVEVPAGFGNFARVLGDSAFGNAMANTIVFTAASVLLHFALGLGAALLLNLDLAGRGILRVVALVPWTIAPVIVAVLWRWMYNAQFGIINDVAMRLGMAEPKAWLGEATLAMPAVIMANVWRGFPFAMLIALAGLQAVPREQLEAAAVDGAGALRRFWHVTLPNIRYVLMVGLVLDAIWTFKQLDLVQVMTGGGPADATDVLTTLIYRTAFEYLDFPYASAMAVTMFAFLGILTAFYVRSVMRESEV